MRLYNKRGTAELWIKESKQAVNMTRPELPPVPVERGAAVAEHHRLHPGEPVIAARAVEEDRHLVADEPPATPGEGGRPSNQTHPVLLGPAGGRAPDAEVCSVRFCGGLWRCRCQPG